MAKITVSVPDGHYCYHAKGDDGYGWYGNDNCHLLGLDKEDRFPYCRAFKKMLEMPVKHKGPHKCAECAGTAGDHQGKDGLTH